VVTEFIDPSGKIVMEEEDSIRVHLPPEARDSYAIDFKFTLRPRDKDLRFDKNNVAGLAIRMPWDPGNPRQQTHLNANGERGRACERKRAAWCNVERPFDGVVFGIAVLDHPSNPGFPSQWRVDEQGLINPAVTGVDGFVINRDDSRSYQYRILIYSGTAPAEKIETEFQKFKTEK
jgi:hypothetical protein